MPYEFPARLLLLLRKTGTSNALLARNVNAVGTTVQNWIDDKTSPKANVACMIADFFGVDMNELFGFTELTDERIAEVQRDHIAKYGNTKRVELVPVSLPDSDSAELDALKKQAAEESDRRE